MIPANKSRLFSWWFSRHAEKRMRRMFSAGWVRGLDGLRCDLERGPVVVVTNHSSWWDPMFAIVLVNRILGTDGYALMEAKNLRRLPFLGRLGGFGVERDVANDGKAVVRYAADLLDRPGRLLWVFPQGDERPLTEPLEEFHHGAAAISALSGARVVTAALRYEFGNLEHPRLFAFFGSSFVAPEDVERGREAQRDGVVEQLERVDRCIRDGDWRECCTPLFDRAPSLLGAAAERVLAWMTRY